MLTLRFMYLNDSEKVVELYRSKSNEHFVFVNHLNNGSTYLFFLYMDDLIDTLIPQA